MRLYFAISTNSAFLGLIFKDQIILRVIVKFKAKVFIVCLFIPVKKFLTNLYKYGSKVMKLASKP